MSTKQTEPSEIAASNKLTNSASLLQLPAAPGIAKVRYLYLLGIAILAIASFASLQLSWGNIFSFAALESASTFLADFIVPNLGSNHLQKIALASLETLAMSIIGSLLAFVFGLMLAIPASLENRGPFASTLRATARLILNISRSIPELVWAALLLIAAGLGPFAGCLALAAHTTGVLGRLYADLLENLEPHCHRALRNCGASRLTSFFYASLPQAWPQMLAYLLYRWENNIRAASILGVVGAGGIGQMLKFHLSLFQMSSAATVLYALLILIALVDALSFACRRKLMA